MAAAGHASSDKEERRDCMMQMEDFLLVLRRGIAATVEETRQSGKTCLQMAGRAYYPLKEAALLGQDQCRGSRGGHPSQKVMRPPGGSVATFRYGM
mmetsp:Transcript_24920/g.68089  ORF Transcript_24920/g.68089 Transcript_24920/m.68089 type:complete len:96 (-) Transcript_24920:39-326(-)